MSASEALQELIQNGILFDSVSVPPTEHIYQGSHVGPLDVNRDRIMLVPTEVRPPAVIRLFCRDPKCESVMDWVLMPNNTPSARPDPLKTGYSLLEYCCRHTPDCCVVLFLNVKRIEDSVTVIELLGRDPKPTPFLSPDLEKALGEIDRDRYSKALTCRANALGIAALAYMRRVIEGEMDRLIDLIIEALPDGDDSLRESLFQVKGAYQFSEKAVVADAKLPGSFFPGNQNPFTRIHELTSEGVHLLDDVESAEQFDECRELFEMLFEKLLRERDTQRLYRDRLTKLKRRSKT
jgi:hypothetical protein